MTSRSIFTLFPFLGLAAVVVHCGGTAVNGAAAGSCNVDGDCKSVDELCRDHKCVQAPTSKVDKPDLDANVSTQKDGGNAPDASLLEDPLASCNVIDVATQRDPLVLEIVLDGSGSMDSDNKWTAAIQGLNGFFNDMLAHPEPTLGVGLTIFEDTNDPTHGTGPYPSVLDVPPETVNQAHHTKLTMRLNGTSPSGGTPTYLALSGVYAQIKNFKAPAGSPLIGARKTVVLISDGVPNGGATEQAQCTAAATAALNLAAPMGPITTFAVGVGMFPATGALGYDPKFMGDLAVAGGTRAKPQCNPAATNLADVCHVQITPGGPTTQMAQAFSSAVQRARTAATGCELKLDTSTSFDASRARVSVTGPNGKPNKLVQGDPDGWDFDDETTPTKIVFSGLACDALQTGTPVKVEACEP